MEVIAMIVPFIVLYYLSILVHLSGLLTIYKHRLLTWWGLLIPFYYWRKKFFIH